MTLTREHPLALDASVDFPQLRTAFTQAGYDAENLQKLLDIPDIGVTPGVNSPLCKRRLPKDATVSTLFRLFRMGLPVSFSEAARAFAPLSVAQVTATGLVEVTGDAVSSAFDVQIYDRLLLLSDRVMRRAEKTGPELHADHVLGVSASGIISDVLTIRAPAAKGLDLGTGNGLLALLAARHVKELVATDVNDRALNVAAFNAKLNGLNNVTFRKGSWFEPVAGEKFDLIVSNPPFVSSPETKLILRDGGMRGDGVTQLVAQGMAAHLNEGGHGTMIGSWNAIPNSDWAARPREWLDKAGVDGLALLTELADPVQYATKWLTLQTRSPEELDRLLPTWLDYYEDCGLKGFATGGIVLRRTPAGINNCFFGFAIPPTSSPQPSCEQLQRQFQAIDYLRALPFEEALFDRRFRLVDGHRITQNAKFHQGQVQVTDCSLYLTQGTSFSEPLNPVGFQFLANCDGQRSVKEIIEAVHAATKYPLEKLVPASLDAVQRWLVSGMIVTA
jgi:methylase of polypeptide subunit release factors